MTTELIHCLPSPPPPLFLNFWVRYWFSEMSGERKSTGRVKKLAEKNPPPPQAAVRARRTCGSVGANTGEIGEAINAGSSVLTRLAVALVYLALTVSTCVAGIADAREIVSSIDARSVNARHADTVITVHLAASAVVT